MSEASKFGNAVKSAAGKVEQKVGTESMASHGERLQAESDAKYKAEQAEQKGQGVLNSAIGKGMFSQPCNLPLVKQKYPTETR